MTKPTRGTAPRRTQAVALRNCGHDTKEIAELMTLSPSAVRMYLHRARVAGKPATPPPKDVAPVLKKLSPEIVQWLLDTAPQGASPLDMIVAIVRDAYFSEMPLAQPESRK